MNHKMIRNILGWLLLFECGFLILPVIIGLIYGEFKIILYYLITSAISAVTGLLLKLGKTKKTTLYARDGFVIVTLSWIVMSFFGAIPMFLTKEIPNFLDAIFESVSGFTTTGATIINDIEVLSHATMFWRSFTHWIGGMGVLVFLMAFLPLSGAQNMHIMKAESSGPSVSKLVPRVRTTALILYLLYFGFTLAEFILLAFGNMSVFESLCTALSTAGTGVFGIRNDSLANVGLYSQIVVTVFMVLFSITFTSYYLILCGKLKEAFTGEVKAFLMIYATATVTITIIIRNCYDSLYQAFHRAAFTIASTTSSTGFVIVDYEAWPKSAQAIILFLMFVGACAGSTGGGIKVSRWVILFKGAIRELHAQFHPGKVKNVYMDKKRVDDATVNSVFAYFGVFILLFATSVIIVSFDKCDFLTSFSAVNATINNIGLGLSMAGPIENFYFFSPLSKCVMLIDMLAGRLEMFPVLITFMPSTWKR